MDLVEEYLRFVGLLLPKAQREDIVAELRDTILTRIEAREAELGRKLTRDETEAVLREIGHPLLVAARYREGPQHLVGPALYPYWAFAVKIAVTLLAIVAAVTFAARLLTTGDMAFALGTALAPALTGAISLIGVATVVAWIVERQGISIRYLERWRVRDLHSLEFLAWDFDALRERLSQPSMPPRGPAARAAQGTWNPRPPVSSARARCAPPTDRAVGAMAVGAIVVLWWIGLLPFGLIGSPAQLRELGLDPGPLAQVDWNAVRAMLYWPVLAYGVALVAQGVILWTQPRSVRLHGLVNLSIAAAVFACVGWVWTASPLAPSLQVESVAGLVLELREALRQPPPKPVAPFAALVLAAIAFGALCRGLHGLFQLVLGAPAEFPTDRPAAVR